jgi:hypothetical protein
MMNVFFTLMMENEVYGRNQENCHCVKKEMDVSEFLLEECGRLKLNA